jgi:DNA-binding response OmpR family regulator
MARAAGVTIPFVVITAFPEASLSDTVERLDGTTMLDKPFDEEELVASIEELMLSPRVRS